MAESTAKLESAGRARMQDMGERAQDYVDRAAQTASAGMDRMADTARKTVDTATDSAKAGLEWASDRASALRERNAAIVDAVTDTVSARPLVAVAVAAAAGYLLGRLMRSGD